MLFDIVTISPNAPPGCRCDRERYVRRHSLTQHDIDLNSKPYSYMYWNDDTMQQSELSSLEKKVKNLEQRVKELEQMKAAFEVGK